MDSQESTSAYQVDLSLYSGPLDLLIYLVRRNELDLMDLPISTITAQFLEYIEILQEINFDEVGDFLVMASTLIEIKSREVLPQPEEETVPEDEDEEFHSNLIEHLVQYKKFKDAANSLETQAAQWQERYPRLSNDRPKSGKDPSADYIKEVELWDLVSALNRILKTTEASGVANIKYDDTPISVYIERIGAQVRKEGRLSFSSFFEGTNFRSKIVSIFMAILELLRHHQFRAEQPKEYGEIWIMPPLKNSENAIQAESVDNSLNSDQLEKEMTRQIQPKLHESSEIPSDDELPE